jgi:hypothetical protein
MKSKELPIFREPDAKASLTVACRSKKVTLTLLRELVDIQREYLGSGRQMGITQEFDAVLAEFLERGN